MSLIAGFVLTRWFPGPRRRLVVVGILILLGCIVAWTGLPAATDGPPSSTGSLAVMIVPIVIGISAAVGMALAKAWSVVRPLKESDIPGAGD